MTENLLLSSLQPDDRNRLLVQMRKVAFHQGDLLMNADEPVHTVYFPVSGVLSLISPFTDGSTVECATVGHEGTVGALAACGSGIMRSCVMAKYPGEAWAIEAKAFCVLHEAAPLLRKMLAQYSEMLLTEARQETACRTRHALEGRLARMLLTLADKADSASLPLSQEFAATLMGAQRTSVNAAAKALKDAGGIRYSRGNIIIADRSSLQRHACECYSAMRRYRAQGGDVVAEPSVRQIGAPALSQPEPQRLAGG